MMQQVAVKLIVPVGYTEEEISDMVFEAGGDDGLLSCYQGVWMLDVDREGESPDAVVAELKQQLGQAGIGVEG